MPDRPKNPDDAPEQERTTIHLVVLVHGIRDFGEGQDLVKAVLEQIPGVLAAPFGYGRFDPVRFLLPGFRETPRRIVSNNIKQQIAILQKKYDDVKISIVAHSFGTYVVMGILEDEANLELEYLVFCGSVLPRLQNFRSANSMVKHKIINFAGCHDIWPVLAKLCSFGAYGDAGTFGFQSAGPENRYFNIGHSGYFTREFIEENWRKVFEGHDVVKGAMSMRTYPPMVRWLGSLFNGALTVSAALVVAGLIYMSPFFKSSTEAARGLLDQFDSKLAPDLMEFRSCKRQGEDAILCVKKVAEERRNRS